VQEQSCFFAGLFFTDFVNILILLVNLTHFSLTEREKSCNYVQE